MYSKTNILFLIFLIIFYYKKMSTQNSYNNPVTNTPNNTQVFSQQQNFIYKIIYNPKA